MNRYDWMRIVTTGYRPPNLAEKFKKKTQDKTTVELRDNDNAGKISQNAEQNLSKEALAKKTLDEINEFRAEKEINVSGADISPPIRTFTQLQNDFKVRDAILENFRVERYTDPMPVQMQTWPLLLEKREVLTCAPTGSGKTAAFLLPIIHQLKQPVNSGFRALIVAPTKELAAQIVRECDRLSVGTGLRASVIKPGTTAKLSYFRKIDVLVTPPQSLLLLIQENKVLRALLSRMHYLIVDESDKLFDNMGKRNFRDQLAELFRACAGPKVVRAMFSATISFDLEQWCWTNFNNVAIVRVGLRNAVMDVEQKLSFCSSNAGKVLELHHILNMGYELPCLIFVQTKERAISLCEEILVTNRPVRCIHSDLTMTKRASIMQEFRERKVWIMISTDILSRGIDFKGVNLVINFDCPSTVTSYVHRVGRTGRAGRKGKSMTFWTLDDRPIIKKLATVVQMSGSTVDDWMLELKHSENKEEYHALHQPKLGSIYETMPNVDSDEKLIMSRFNFTKNKKWIEKNKYVHERSIEMVNENYKAATEKKEESGLDKLTKRRKKAPEIKRKRGQMVVKKGKPKSSLKK